MTNSYINSNRTNLVFVNKIKWHVGDTKAVGLCYFQRIFYFFSRIIRGINCMYDCNFSTQ